MNRVDFFNSVSGIQYPDMIVNFFDQFIALKQLVEGNGRINVLNSNDKSITFSIDFINIESKNNALAMINSLGGHIIIYGKPIGIKVDIITDLTIQINLI